MKSFVSFGLKLGFMLGVFVAIFLEFGGGYQPIPTAAVHTPGTFLGGEHRS